MEDSYKKLLDNNKLWSEGQLRSNPTYFEELAKGQNPEYLWIGCSDSRAPANIITGMLPGQIFEHRNIANMVVHSDMNMLSVLSYAVEVLQVKHVIVCGHYGCGGVLAAMGNNQLGLIDNWLRNIKDVYRLHQDELDAIADENTRVKRFVELNVMEQVFDLTKTSIVQNAWRTGQSLHVHGWVYDMNKGIIKDLEITYTGPGILHPIYRFNAQAVEANAN